MSDIIPAAKLTAKEIAKWALANKEQARKVGLLLFTHQKDPDALRAEDSLGDFEDQLILWAIKSPFKAKALMMKLMPRLAT